jgi:hypothetical protein
VMGKAAHWFRVPGYADHLDLYEVDELFDRAPDLATTMVGIREDGTPLWFRGARSLPRYSTEMEAAWQIVEYMARNHVRCELRTYLVNEGYSAEFSGRPWTALYAETMPLAICRAALRWADEYRPTAHAEEEGEA